jgi:streptomycin 6-kinase
MPSHPSFWPELWPLPVRACHDSPWLHLASETQPASLFASGRECLDVAMGAGAKIVCAARGTITLVQYAAYLTLLACLARDGGSREYNSILITLVRATLHLLFPQVSPDNSSLTSNEVQGYC